MSSDEIKQETRVRSSPSVQSLMDLARRSVPDLRRNAETIEPVPASRRGALAAQLRRTLDWTRLPGLKPREENRPQPACWCGSCAATASSCWCRRRR